jgi:hypothetical protein
MLLIFAGMTIYVLYLVKEFDRKIPISTPGSSCQMVCQRERAPEEQVVWSVIPGSISKAIREREQSYVTESVRAF